MLNFNIDWDKSVEAVHFLADLHRDITRLYIAKVIYFADKEHLLDWGRPITGDTFVAMKHGPVPSHIYNLVQSNSRVPAGLRQRFNTLLKPGNSEVALRTRKRFAQHFLSDSDLKSLRAAHRRYGWMTWNALIDAGHRELAWREAWDRRGYAESIKMDVEKLIDNDAPNRDGLLEEIREKAGCVFA